MNAHPGYRVDSCEELEARHLLERAKMDRAKSAEDSRRKIPKLYRRSNQRAQSSKQSPEYFNKKVPKKECAKSSLLYDSLLNLDDQVRINKNILELQNKWGLSIIQKNGQRKLGGPPPGWKGPPPGPGCEIFVGRIPRNIYEDVIYPVFRKIGGIYEMRLMMNFSGTNRGFCFIMYENAELAQKAIKELNHYEIVPGWFIGVVESVNNCRLHVTDLPSQTNAQALIRKIWPVCEDIDKVSVYTNINNPQIKHALISFKTHRSAAMARRRLLPERNKFFDKSEVRIEWAHPKIAITNVIEETGFYNDNGKLEIIKKVVGQTKSSRKKRSLQNSNKSYNVEALKNSQIEENHYEDPVSFRIGNFDLIVNNSNLEKSPVDQTVYDEDVYCSESNCNECTYKFYDNLKYSMRSDESLSDFSKNSDFDDYKNISYSPNEVVYNNISSVMNPINCSVIPYPWNIHNPNQHVNTQRHDFNFYNIRYPWKIVKETNASVQIQEQLDPYLLNYETLKCRIPIHFNNNFREGENPPSYHHELAITARPILNRGILTA